MSIKVMKQALEALESITWVNSFNDGDYLTCNFKDVETSIIVLRQAIEQAEQAHSCVACDDNPKGNNNSCAVCGLAQPDQKPAAWMKVGGMKAMPALEKEAWLNTGRQFDRELVEEYTIPLYTAPPQRQPLTHPQIHELDWPDGVAFEDILLFARAIEAAHGITGDKK